MGVDLTKDKFELPPPLWEECITPSEAQRTPEPQSQVLGWRRHSAAEQDCADLQECHLLCAQATRGSNCSSNNRAASLEHSAGPDTAFPTQTHFPAQGLNQHQPQTYCPFSHYPATRKMSDSNTFEMNFICRGMNPGMSHFIQCKTICSVSVWVIFCFGWF